MADFVRWRQVIEDPPAHVLIAESRSDREYVVTRVMLRDCVNVRGGCPRTLAMNVVLSPRNRVDLMTVYPADPDKEFSFDWVYRGELVPRAP